MGRVWGTKNSRGGIREGSCLQRTRCNYSFFVILSWHSNSSIFSSQRHFLWSGFLFFVSSLITASFASFSWGSKISASSLLRGGDSQSSSWPCFLLRLHSTITGEETMPPSGLFSIRYGEVVGDSLIAVPFLLRLSGLLHPAQGTSPLTKVVMTVRLGHG